MFQIDTNWFGWKQLTVNLGKITFDGCQRPDQMSFNLDKVWRHLNSRWYLCHIILAGGEYVWYFWISFMFIIICWFGSVFHKRHLFASAIQLIGPNLMSRTETDSKQYVMSNESHLVEWMKIVLLGSLFRYCLGCCSPICSQFENFQSSCMP